MQGADAPRRAPRTLFSFNSANDIAQIATGCDTDIGGLSTVHFDLDESPQNNVNNQHPLTGKFWGEMRLSVKPELQGKLRTGYAGFRNKFRPTLFGELCDDVSLHKYLALRLRAGGDPRTRNSYFVNIQTDGPISTDLWQHRLFFQKNDNSWEDLYIPFDNFVLTNSGEVSERQIEMLRERIRSIGISLLGGNSGVEGSYELGIDSIRIVNDDDILRP